MTEAFRLDYEIHDANAVILANMAGELDCHVKSLESRLGVLIVPRGAHFFINGPEESVDRAEKILRNMEGVARRGKKISPGQMHQWIYEFGRDEEMEAPIVGPKIQTRKGTVEGRSPRQKAYLKAILDYDLTFGVGPAGTGKTYLAVAAAVDLFNRDVVRRIVLVRPAVEAGERLGFLPGGLEEKVDPYLRPLYDALYEMLGFEKFAKLQERQVIEVAPLAYMRGRTLNESFIILDEAQNTTPEQMKMFLTRIGFGSKAVVTGDVTQVDLPRGQISGLAQVIDILHNMEGVEFVFFQNTDVIRHPLVARIVSAYQRFEQS